MSGFLHRTPTQRQTPPTSAREPGEDTWGLPSWATASRDPGATTPTLDAVAGKGGPQGRGAQDCVDPTYSWAGGADVQTAQIATPEFRYPLSNSDYMERAKIPHHHVILEELARIAYNGRSLANDEVVDQSYDLWQLGYRHVRTIGSDDTGLQAMLFEPTVDEAALGPGSPIAAKAARLPPVVAFRGSHVLLDFLDDANPTGIGTFQFAMHEAEIRGLLAQGNALGRGRPAATGHSLGGAQAQLAAARYGNMIGEIVTFQSPGIDADEAKKVDPEQHPSSHYRVGGDPVAMAGERMTEGDVYEFGSYKVAELSFAAHLKLPLASLNDQRRRKGLAHVPGVDAPADDRRAPDEGMTHRSGQTETATTYSPFSAIAEPTRKGLGNVAPVNTLGEMEAAADAWHGLRGKVIAAAGRGETPEAIAEATRAALGEVTWVDRVQVLQSGLANAKGVLRHLSPKVIDGLVNQAEMLGMQFESERRHGKWWDQGAAG